MDLSTTVWVGFGWGLFGGIIVEIASFYKFRFSKEKPHWFKSRFYWLITISMILIGGGLVVMYLNTGQMSLSPLVAVNIGASAPTIIASLASKAPNIPPGKVDFEPEDKGK